MPFDPNDAQSVISYLLGIVTLFMSITCHEYAHGWAAFKMGDSTAKDAGRLTFNPFRHMDPVGTLLILVGAPIGWAKPVPVNPNNFTGKYRGRRGTVIISLSGITANLLLAIGAYLLQSVIQVSYAVSGRDPAGWAGNLMVYVLIFCLLMFYRNIALAIFNLLPVPPLDGFKFISVFLPRSISIPALRYERQIGLVFFLLIIVDRAATGGQMLSTIFTTLQRPIVWLISTPIDQLAGFILGRTG